MYVRHADTILVREIKCLGGAERSIFACDTFLHCIDCGRLKINRNFGKTPIRSNVTPKTNIYYTVAELDANQSTKVAVKISYSVHSSNIQVLDITVSTHFLTSTYSEYPVKFTPTGFHACEHTTL